MCTFIKKSAEAYIKCKIAKIGELAMLSPQAQAFTVGMQQLRSVAVAKNSCAFSMRKAQI